MSETCVDLIRHGEPVGGRAIRGSSIDDPLSTKGFKQMRAAILNYSSWDIIISSPMSRCVEFATQLSSNLKCELIVEDSLIEVGFGAWEGRTQDEIQKSNPKEFNDFYLDPVNLRPKGAECLSDFSNRVVACYNRLINNYSGQSILIVTHAGVIRAIICYILQADLKSMYRIKVKNAGLTRIIHNGERAVLDAHSFKLI